MENNEKLSIVKKYYCALEGSHVTVLCRDPFEFEEEHYDGTYLAQYAEAIQNLFDEHIAPEGIAEYLGLWDGSEKVREVILHTEIRNNSLWACFTVMLSAEMTTEEENFLYQAIEGQTFAGVGESIMNGSIPTDKGDMTIALWTPGAKLYTESEYLKLIQ